MSVDTNKIKALCCMGSASYFCQQAVLYSVPTSVIHILWLESHIFYSLLAAHSA